MSLFKSREWWSTICGVNETFGASHMCITKYENVASGVVKHVIIVGSLEGYLRIYDPQSPSAAETSEQVSSSSDLQLETQLALPILAVESGRFSSTAEGLHVAVLHPKHLRVLRVTMKDSSQVNSHCVVDFMYEHALPLDGFSLTVGPFWLCVQSLTEGTLMFFENERAGILCRLPDPLFLLPSPICYVPFTESLIICDSSWNLQSFNYQSLANSTLEQQKTRSDWELELGEPAIDLQTIGSFIVVLGERHLYCLKDTGSIVWTRKLDYHPMCCNLLIPPDSPESVVVLVCSDANTLLVYKDNVVEWNCKLPFTPLVIKTATLQCVDGLTVTLSDVGQLVVSYMGTQQVQYGFLQAPRRTINYQQGLEEIGKLSAQSLGKVSTINVLADNRNGPSTSLDLQLESDVDRHYIPGDNRPVDAIRGRLNLLLTDSCRLQTVNLSINCVDSLLIATPCEAVLQLDSEGQASLAVLFHANKKKSGIVSSLQVQISAVIGTSWTTTKHLNLPLKLVTKLTTPVREALVKVTLATNQPANSLVQLFNELQVDDSMSNVMAFEHLDGTRVSILVSKTTNKYRIQSDCLAALSLPVVELQRRLKTAKVVLDSALPVQETWHRIEHHYATWLELKSQMENLSRATRQFQIIQRLFHNKILNTKTAEATLGVLSALQLAHDHVKDCIDKVEQSQEVFDKATNSLKGSIQCILTLLKLLPNYSEKQPKIQLVEKALLFVDQLDFDQPWQHSADVKLRHVTNNSTPEKEFNLTSFKKIFLQTFDAFIKDPQP